MYVAEDFVILIKNITFNFRLTRMQIQFNNRLANDRQASYFTQVDLHKVNLVLNLPQFEVKSLKFQFHLILEFPKLDCLLRMFSL